MDNMKAYEHIAAQQNVSLFIFGDHASRYIPPKLNNLGLSGVDLTRHIAWDIGTADIIRALCKHFACAGQLAALSRLVIDLNRDINTGGLIPVESDGTHIPGNQNLSKSQRQQRIDNFYTPYHNALSDELDKRRDDPLVISMHSFTPKPLTGAARDVDIGLLVKHDVETAQKFADVMKRIAPQFTMGMNEPYSAFDLNYTVDAHIGPRGLRHLAIELRQDHIDNQSGVQQMIHHLIKAISALLE